MNVYATQTSAGSCDRCGTYTQLKPVWNATHSSFKRLCANCDPEIVFTDGVAPIRCGRCEGLLAGEALVEIVLVNGNHTLLHADTCYDGEPIA